MSQEKNLSDNSHLLAGAHPPFNSAIEVIYRRAPIPQVEVSEHLLAAEKTVRELMIERALDNGRQFYKIGICPGVIDLGYDTSIFFGQDILNSSQFFPELKKIRDSLGDLSEVVDIEELEKLKRRAKGEYKHWRDLKKELDINWQKSWLISHEDLPWPIRYLDSVRRSLFHIQAPLRPPHGNDLCANADHQLVRVGNKEPVFPKLINTGPRFTDTFLAERVDSFGVGFGLGAIEDKVKLTYREIWDDEFPPVCSITSREEAKINNYDNIKLAWDIFKLCYPGGMLNSREAIQSIKRTYQDTTTVLFKVKQLADQELSSNLVPLTFSLKNFQSSLQINTDTPTLLDSSLTA